MWKEEIMENPDIKNKYQYWIKQHDEATNFGVDGGRIIKLIIRKFGESRDSCNYDLEWKVKPIGEVKSLYAAILKKYN